MLAAEPVLCAMVDGQQHNDPFVHVVLKTRVKLRNLGACAYPCPPEPRQPQTVWLLQCSSPDPPRCTEGDLRFAAVGSSCCMPAALLWEAVAETCASICPSKEPFAEKQVHKFKRFNLIISGKREHFSLNIHP